MSRMYRWSLTDAAVRGIWIVLMALVICGSLGLSALFADTIELNNGSKFEGRILQETPDRVQMELQTGGSRLWFPRSAIKSMHRTQRPKVQPLDEQEKAQQRRKAKKQLQKMGMLDSGGTRPTTMKLREKRSSRQSQEDQPSRARTGASDHVEKLIELLESPDWHIASSAAQQLGEIGDERAIPALIYTLRVKKQPFLERAAFESLKEITGRDLGFRPQSSRIEKLQALDKWQEWWEEKQRDKGK